MSTDSSQSSANYSLSEEIISQFSEFTTDAENVVVIQAENPDGDSLSSALALEALLLEQGKQASLYCPVQIPRHLRHIVGWDRVSDELASDFDSAIIVDTSSMSLLEKTFAGTQKTRITKQPVLVIDHHDIETDLDFHHTLINDNDSVATGEVIYLLARALGWKIPADAAQHVASSIMYDSLGLNSQGTTVRTIHVLAEVVALGANLAELDEGRRQMMRKSADLTEYKGRLLQRIETIVDGRIAMLHIPWEEIEAYSDKYNPSMLVIDDMRLIEGVELAIAIKTYPDGKATAKIRANMGFENANSLAEHFGGGGHPYAAGFKIHGKTYDDVKREIAQYYVSQTT